MLRGRELLRVERTLQLCNRLAQTWTRRRMTRKNICKPVPSRSASQGEAHASPCLGWRCSCWRPGVRSRRGSPGGWTSSGSRTSARTMPPAWSPWTSSLVWSIDMRQLRKTIWRNALSNAHTYARRRNIGRGIIHNAGPRGARLLASASSTLSGNTCLRFRDAEWRPPLLCHANRGLRA